MRAASRARENARLLENPIPDQRSSRRIRDKGFRPAIITSDAHAPSPPRPVTPLGIAADRLRRARERAASLGYDDAAFLAELDAAHALIANLEPYLARCASPASPALQALAADTARRDWSGLHEEARTAVPLEQEMLSGHIEGALLALLVRATRARRVLEIGLFTGYSALAMAEALPPEGTLLACEIDAYVAEVARANFARSPHGAKITVEVAPALETLRRVAERGERFDFVFIDADKGGYAAYLDIVLEELLAPDGLICVDNTLMQGLPYAGGERGENGAAIATFNDFVARDARLEKVLVPLRDGVTLIRRAAP